MPATAASGESIFTIDRSALEPLPTIDVACEVLLAGLGSGVVAVTFDTFTSDEPGNAPLITNVLAIRRVSPGFSVPSAQGNAVTQSPELARNETPTGGGVSPTMMLVAGMGPLLVTSIV